MPPSDTSRGGTTPPTNPGRGYDEDGGGNDGGGSGREPDPNYPDDGGGNQGGGADLNPGLNPSVTAVWFEIGRAHV